MYSAVLIILAISIAGAAFIYSKLRVPKNLAHIPSPSVFSWISALLASDPFDNTVNKISREQLIKTKIQRQWKFGLWGVLTSSPKAAKKLYNDTISFPKSLPTDFIPDSLFSKFNGINLVFSNHDIWKRHRSVLNPPFKKKFDPEIFADCSRKFFEVMDGKFQGNDVDVYKYMQKITMDAMGKGIMGVEFNSITDDDVFFISAYNQIMKAISNPFYFIFWFLDAEWFPWRTKGYQTLKKLEEYFQTIIDSKRKRLQENPSLADANHVDTDILTLMVEASQDEKTRFTDKEIRDNIMIFVLAGHDTTAFAMSAALHFFAQTPKVQYLARKEVMEVMSLKDYHRGQPENCPSPNAEQAKQLVYLMAVMKETMRLYPSVARLPARITSKDVELEGYSIPPGVFVELDIYSMHRDPDNFTNPDKFIPERFLEGGLNSDVKESVDTSLWTPFGGGTRSCIGLNFSILEQKVVLAMILMRYKISYSESCPQSKGAPLLLGPSQLMVPTNLRLNFELL